MKKTKPIKKKERRGRGFIRQWTLLRLLTDNRYMTVQKLAVELDVRPKTVYRDIRVLTSVGVELYRVRTDEGQQFLRVKSAWFQRVSAA